MTEYPVYPVGRQMYKSWRSDKKKPRLERQGDVHLRKAKIFIYRRVMGDKLLLRTSSPGNINSTSRDSLHRRHCCCDGAQA